MAVQNPKLLVCQWNARSVRNKKVELEQFLISKNIDVCFVSETYLDDSDTFKLNGYKVYRKNRDNNNNHGTALIIKNEISQYEVKIPHLNKIEATAVNITASGKNITIVSVYNSPVNNYKDCEGDLGKIFNFAPVILAAGDYNAKHTFWGSRVINTFGRNLLKFCRDEDLIIHAPNEFTHYPDITIQNPAKPNQNSRKKPKPDLIDFAIAKNFPYNLNSKVMHELHSDHTPIIHYIDFSCDFDIRKPRYNFVKTNWDKFYLSLRESKSSNSKFESTDDIDKEIANITKNIKVAIKVSTPQRKFKRDEIKLPEYFEKLINSRNALTQQIRKSPNTNLKMKETSYTNKYNVK